MTTSLYAPRVNVGNLQPAEHSRRLLHYACPPGVTFDDLSKPGYWLPVSSRVRKWDRIEVVADDDFVFLEMIVTSVDGEGVHVKPLRAFDIRQLHKGDE